MATYKTIAIVDDVHTCDCCGKSNLKATVAMERDDGEVVHFGSVCASRHSGRDAKTIRREVELVRQEKRDAAEREYKACPERIAYDAKLAEARRAGISPGLEFAAFVREAANAAHAAAKLIAAKHGSPVVPA